MKSNTVFFLVCTMTISLYPVSGKTQILIMDKFETLDMSATNSDGFVWRNNNRTSVVTHNAIDGPVAVYNNGNIYNIADPVMPDGTIRDWTAFDGDYSLRFRYAAGQPWAEQRFKIGAAYQEIWVSFMARVPTNFSHAGAGNAKLFAIWMDGYSQAGDGATAFWNYWNDGTDGSQVSVTWTEGEFTASVSQTQFVPFIDLATDKGRWMELVFKVKAATNRTSEDGTLDLWRRWDGDTDYEHLHSVQNVDMPPSPDLGNVDGAGWSNGYLMGWANDGFAVDTEWLFDNFTLSETSLLESRSMLFSNSFE